jgi:hypothetical protein
MKSTQAVKSNEDKLSVTCPICDEITEFIVGEEEIINTSCNYECCSSLLLIEGNTVYPFHEKINESTPEYPKDGTGAYYIEV